MWRGFKIRAGERSRASVEHGGLDYHPQINENRGEADAGAAAGIAITRGK